MMYPIKNPSREKEIHIMKKLIAIVCAVLMLATLAACAPADDGKITVGICQIEPHPALDAATKGFKDVLKAEFGDKIEFVEGNAAGDSNTLNSIITDFVSKKVDLILANATPVLQTASAATTVIPILGTSVTEYGVALNIENFSGTVGGNISGTSDLADLDKQAQMIIDWFPEAKKIGLLYCASEANSKYQVDSVKAFLEGKGLTATLYSFSGSSDMAAVTEKAAAESDVIYVPTDNTIANGTGVVDGICRAKKVPIIAGEEGICSGCGVATLSISYEELGKTTGQMAIKVLKGEAKIGEMAIQYDPNPVYKYNKEICDELNLTPPEGYVAIG